MIGDRYSAGEPETNWIGAVASELGWGEVVNLSAPGRGFVKKSRACDLEVCATFEGSIGLIVDAAPDVVVTFGGTADGDYSLKEAAPAYFEALRDALPDAELIAISPVTGDDEAPYWLTLHRKTITAAVEAVGGTAVNVGQPGLGDGDDLSAESQADLAATIIEQLAAA